MNMLRLLFGKDRYGMAKKIQSLEAQLNDAMNFRAERDEENSVLRGKCGRRLETIKKQKVTIAQLQGRNELLQASNEMYLDELQQLRNNNN